MKQSRPKIQLKNTKERDFGDGWATKQNLSIGKKHTEYYYKGKRAKRNVMVGKIAEKYAAYALIEKDIRTILSWLDKVDNFFSDTEILSNAVIRGQEEKDYDLSKAIFIAIVSFYGRLFTSCDGRKVKLEKRVVPLEYLPIHDELMNYRHNFVAHAGISNAESVNIICAFPPRSITGSSPRLFIELQQLDTIFYRDNKKTIKGLARHLQKIVQNKMMELHDKIHQEQIFSK